MTGKPVVTESHGVVTEFVLEENDVNKEVAIEEENKVGQEENDEEIKEIKDERVLEVEDKENKTEEDKTVDHDSVTADGVIGTTSAEPVHTEIVTSSEMFEMDKDLKIGAAVDKSVEKTPEFDNKNNKSTPRQGDKGDEMTPKHEDNNYETTPEPDYSDDWLWKAVNEPESVADHGVKLEPIGIHVNFLLVLEFRFF